MCVAVIKRSKSPKYAFFVSINREEKNENAYKLWDYHWCNYPNIYGCLDIKSGGTWIALNTYGVFGALLNKESIPSSGTKSRSHILLESLHNSSSATSVVEQLSARDFEKYKPFNIVIIDKKHAFYFTSESNMHIQTSYQFLDDELTMVNRSFPNDFSQQRIRNNYTKFLSAAEPNPDVFDYVEWQDILSETCYTDSMETEFTMTLISDKWRTLTSSIIAIPRNGTFPSIRDCEVKFFE